MPLSIYNGYSGWNIFPIMNKKKKADNFEFHLIILIQNLFSAVKKSQFFQNYQKSSLHTETLHKTNYHFQID